MELPAEAVVHSKATARKIRQLAHHQCKIPRALVDTAGVGLRWSDDGGTANMVEDIEDIDSLPKSLKDCQVQHVREASFIVKLASWGVVAKAIGNSFQEDLQDFRRRLAIQEAHSTFLEARVQFLEVNNKASFPNIARRC